MARGGVATSVPDVRLSCNVFHAFTLWFRNREGSACNPSEQCGLRSPHVGELSRAQDSMTLFPNKRMIRTALSLSNPSPA